MIAMIATHNNNNATNPSTIDRPTLSLALKYGIGILWAQTTH
jgi:hypothetical protein